MRNGLSIRFIQMLARRQFSKLLEVPGLQWLRNGMFLAEPLAEVD